MRRQVEVAFEARHAGEPLVPWMFRRKAGGMSLRKIADELSQVSGMQVSHESVRGWMLEG